MGVDPGLDNAGRDEERWDSAGQSMPGAGTSRARGLAQDWITLWQSELSAMAADPEMRETWQSLMALWAGTMAASLRAMPTERSYADNAVRRPGTADAPGPPAAAAAPDARDAEIERLARHVAALERRLADIERGGNPPVDPKRRPRRKP